MSETRRESDMHIARFVFADRQGKHMQQVNNNGRDKRQHEATRARVGAIVKTRSGRANKRIVKAEV